jgi:hypothetical protein
VNDVIYFHANMSPDWGSPDGLYRSPRPMLPLVYRRRQDLPQWRRHHAARVPPHLSGYQVMSPTFQVVWACAGICAPHFLNFSSAFDLPSCMQDWRLPPDVYQFNSQLCTSWAMVHETIVDAAVDRNPHSHQGTRTNRANPINISKWVGVFPYNVASPALTR